MTDITDLPEHDPETGMPVEGVTVGEWSDLLSDFELRKLHQLATDGELPNYIDQRIADALSDPEYVKREVETLRELRRLCE